jgi:hypothetical protein
MYSLSVSSIDPIHRSWCWLLQSFQSLRCTGTEWNYRLVWRWWRSLALEVPCIDTLAADPIAPLFCHSKRDCFRPSRIHRRTWIRWKSRFCRLRWAPRAQEEEHSDTWVQRSTVQLSCRNPCSDFLSIPSSLGMTVRWSCLFLKKLMQIPEELDHGNCSWLSTNRRL